MFTTIAAWLTDFFRWCHSTDDDPVMRAEEAHEAFLRITTPPDDTVPR